MASNTKKLRKLGKNLILPKPIFYAKTYLPQSHHQIPQWFIAKFFSDQKNQRVNNLIIVLANLIKDLDVYINKLTYILLLK